MFDALAHVVRGMRDVSLLAAAWVYMSNVSKNQEGTVREVRGLLILITSEVRSNERVLDEVISGNPSVPSNLLDSRYLSEDIWSASRVEMARWLSDHGLFSIISIYYERLRYLMVTPYLSAHGDMENVQQIAESVKDHGAYVRRMAHEHIASLQSNRKVEICNFA